MENNNYEKLLEKARKAYSKCVTGAEKRRLESIFPELAENLDEKIRKEILEFFKDLNEHGYSTKEWIAWVEKQEEQKPYRGNADTMRKNLIKAFKSVGSNHWGGLDVRDIIHFLESKDAIELEKQGNEIIPLEDIIHNVWELGNLWQELTNGVCTTEHGRKIDYIVKHWKEGEYYTKSFEKQCEQKPIEKVEPKFKVGDKVLWKYDKSDPYTIAKVSNCATYWIEHPGCGSGWWSEKELEPYDSAIGINSKFNIGDWIVGEECICKVVDIRGRFYKLYFMDGQTVNIDIPYADEKYRFWTIQDAKDGDVLSYVTDKGNLLILIYKSLYKPYKGHVHYHAILENNKFSDKGTCCISIDNLKPATKEQRDLLFEEMEKSGYIWDVNRKEMVSSLKYK